MNSEKVRSRTMSAFNTYRSKVEKSFDSGAFSDGLSWYDEKRVRLRRLSERSNVPFASTCGICAVMSPLTNWDDNFLATDKMLKMKERPNEEIADVVSKHTTLGKSVEKALALLRGEKRIHQVVRGPKVRPFFYNLSGDLSRVTVDRIMWDAVGRFGLSSDTPTGNARTGIISAVKMLATLYDLKPAQIQAIVWKQVRDYS